MATINRRKWTTKAGEKKSGWEVEWRSPQGARRRRLFSGPGARGDATAERRRRDIEESAGPTPSGEADTVETAGRAWISGLRKEGRAGNTLAHYAYHLERHIAPIEIVRKGEKAPVRFGSIAAKALTTPDCVALKTRLLEMFSPLLAQAAVHHLRMLLSDAARRGTIPINPATPVRVALVDHGEDQVIIPSKAELRQILAAARRRGPFSVAYVTLALFGAPRPQELRGFAESDLVLDGLRPGIAVNRAAEENGLKAVKTANARRFLPLGREAIDALREWLAVKPESKPLKDPFDPNREVRLLLPTGRGTLWSRSTLRRDFWVPLMREAGLATAIRTADGKPASPRDIAAFERLPAKVRQNKPTVRWVPRYELNCFRHAGASLMIEERLDAKVIATRMGHSSVQVTYDLYGHLFRDRENDTASAEAIERRLLGS